MTTQAENGKEPTPWQGLSGDVAWQIAERLVKVGLGFLLSIVVARSLGPATFGIFSFALSIIAIFSFLGQAGLDGLLVRELVRYPGRSSEILSTGMILRVCGSLLAGLAAISTALLTATDQLAPAPLLVIILSFNGLFQSTWVVESWLHANGWFKEASTAKITAYCLSAAIRGAALLLPQPIYALAVASVVESAVCAAIMWATYSRLANAKEKRLGFPSMESVFNLGLVAAPMLISALAIAVYSRIDVLMLGSMVGGQAAGLYAAGTMLSEGFYLIPTALMAAASPRLASLFSFNRDAFSFNLSQLLRLLSILGIAIAVAITILADHIVLIFFGESYLPASQILQIHIWSTVVVFISTASDAWYINHDLRMIYLAKTIVAAILNITLNILLIPKWHGYGAAIATLISYSFCTFVVTAILPETRQLFTMQLRALFGLSTNTDSSRLG